MKSPHFKIVVEFDIPQMLVEQLVGNLSNIEDAFKIDVNGISVYSIRVDTDKKQTLLELCLAESARQSEQDAKVEGRIHKRTV